MPIISYDQIRWNRVILIAVAAIAAGVVAPEQVRELYRTLAQDLSYIHDTWGPAQRWAAATASLALCAVSLAWSAAFVSRRMLPECPSSRSSQITAGVICASVPVFAAWGALASITRSIPEYAQVALQRAIAYRFRLPVAADAAPLAEQLLHYNDMLIQIAAGWFALAVLCFALGFLTDRLRRHDGFWAVGGIAGIASAAMGVGYAVFPVRFTEATGPLPVLFTFAALAVMALSLVGTAADRARRPYTAFVLGLALVFATFGLNSNDAVVRSAVMRGAAVPALPPVGSAFLQWLDSRADFQEFASRGQRYPVYLVAAQGGGMYAGYHVASLLSSLEDRCPAFPQHIFAIAGVSGGSVGAAGYISGRPRDQQTRQRCAPTQPRFDRSRFSQMEVLFDTDLLSPLFAGLLFRDLGQRFVPFALPQLSRVRPLADVLDGHDFRLAGAARSPMGASFWSHWSPTAGVPALMSVATDVDRGTVRVFAPFDAGEGQIQTVSPSAAPELTALTLSDAALASARFPWVLPPASFAEISGGRRRLTRLVDGGYFENSGSVVLMSTLAQLMAALAGDPRRDQVKFHVLLTSTTCSADETVDCPEVVPFTGLNELLAPLQTLLNTRVARGQSAISDALRQVTALRASGHAVDATVVPLAPFGYPLPLGWRLSWMTMLAIQAQTSSQACAQDDGDCAHSKIVKELNFTGR